MGKLLPYKTIHFLHTLSWFQVVYTVQRTRVGWTLRKKTNKKQHHDKIPFPEIWKRHTVLVIKNGSTYTKISQCLVINLRIEQRIQKDLDESYANDDDTTARKLQMIVLIKKTPEFVSVIQASIGKNPSQSIIIIARDLRCVRVYYQVVSA